MCREPGGDSLGVWSCHCKGASVPAMRVWGGAAVTPGMAPEGSDREVSLTSGKCEDTGPEMEADRNTVLRVAEFSCFAPFLSLAVSPIFLVPVGSMSLGSGLCTWAACLWNRGPSDHSYCSLMCRQLPALLLY